MKKIEQFYEKLQSRRLKLKNEILSNRALLKIATLTRMQRLSYSRTIEIDRWKLVQLEAIIEEYKFLYSNELDIIKCHEFNVKELKCQSQD